MRATTTERRAMWVSVPGQHYSGATPEGPPVPGKRFRWGGLLLLVLLAGLLIVCHGCHGDVDDELFSLGWWISAIGR
ncbi:MAG TPA: hypothetical protein VKD72_16630 [Gemmataceae bacterium]|nr:hypothetical protein [Gemmataceae bacterium]